VCPRTARANREIRRNACAVPSRIRKSCARSAAKPEAHRVHMTARMTKTTVAAQRAHDRDQHTSIAIGLVLGLATAMCLLAWIT
jgi:hypothetical protein